MAKIKLIFPIIILVLLLPSCSSIGIMSNTRAYYPVETNASEYVKINGGGFRRIKKTKTDSTIYTKYSNLLACEKGATKTKKFDRWLERYNLELAGGNYVTTKIRKVNGDDFDAYNCIEIESFRDSIFGHIGPVFELKPRIQFFFNQIDITATKNHNYQEVLNLIENYNLTIKHRFTLEGLKIFVVVAPNSVGEGIAEIAMKLQRNPNILHAIINVNGWTEPLN